MVRKILITIVVMVITVTSCRFFTLPKEDKAGNGTAGTPIDCSMCHGFVSW